VKLLLDRGAEVHDTVPKPISTALHLAANFGRYNNARLLLEHGADIHAAESWTKRVPLFYACWMRRPNVARLLLSWGANPVQFAEIDRNQQTTDGWTPLMEAIHAEHFACAREMLSDSKVDLTLRDNEGDTCAARHRALFLLGRRQWTSFPGAKAPRENSSIDLVVAIGFNWLHLAAKYGHQELVKAFVDCGIDVVAVAGHRLYDAVSTE
jgi:ankyrin repeat protein